MPPAPAEAKPTRRRAERFIMNPAHRAMILARIPIPGRA